jgi:AcrR family transcriptional regulator
VADGTSRTADGGDGGAGGRRKRRSREDILGRIFAAATEEFQRCGYSGATTAAIARKADVTEAQLFRYFSSKENLFRETIFDPVDRHFSSFLERYQPGAAGARGARELTALYTTELQEFIDRNADMLRSLVVAEAYEARSAKGVGQIDSLQAYFAHGAAAMQANRGAPAKIPPELMARITFAAVLACVLFKGWLFPPGIAAEGDITAAVNEFIVSAMAANFGTEEEGG